MKNLTLIVFLLFFGVEFASAQLSYNGTVNYRPPETGGPIASINVSITTSANDYDINVKCAFTSVEITAFATERRTYQKSDLPASVTTLFSEKQSGYIFYDVYNGNTLVFGGAEVWDNAPGTLAYGQILHENFDVGNQANQNARGRALYKSGALSIRNVRIVNLSSIYLPNAVFEFEQQQLSKKNQTASSGSSLSAPANTTGSVYITNGNTSRQAQANTSAANSAARTNTSNTTATQRTQTNTSGGNTSNTQTNAAEQRAQALNAQQARVNQILANQQAATDAQAQANAQIAQSAGELANMVGNIILNLGAERQARLQKKAEEDAATNDKINALLPEANAGNAVAMEKIGELTYYLNYNSNRSKPDEKSVSDAAQWFTKAANAGDISAIRWMGWINLYYYKDSKEAVFWYEKAAELGDLASMKASVEVYRKLKFNSKADEWQKKIDVIEPPEPQSDPAFVKKIKIAQKNLDNGRKEYAAGRYESAYQLILAALASVPNDTTVLASAAMAATAAKKYPEAIQHYTQLFKIGSNNMSSYQRLANIYEFLDDDVNAQRTCFEASAKFPAYAKEWNKEANRLNARKMYAEKWRIAADAAANRDFETSYNAFKDCYAISHTDTMLVINLGAAAFQTKRYGESIDYFKQAINMNAMADNVYSNLGKAYLFNKDTVGGISTLSGLAAKYPHNKGLTNIELALYNIAGRNKEAEGKIAGAIANDPTNPETYYYAGVIYIGLERYDNAAEMLNKSLTIDPKNLYAYIQLGNINLKKGAGFSQVAAKNLGNNQAIVKDQVAKAQAQFELAKPYFLKAAAIDPKSETAGAYLGDLYVDWGSSQIFIGDTTSAESLFKQAVSANPKSFDAHMRLGYLYFLDGVKMINKAGRVPESDLKSFLDLYDESQIRFDSARELLGSARELKPESYNANFHLGYTLFTQASSFNRMASRIKTTDLNRYSQLTSRAAAYNKEAKPYLLKGLALYPKSSYSLNIVLDYYQSINDEQGAADIKKRITDVGK